MSSSAAVNAAQELGKKAEHLRLTSDSLIQIDNMSDHLQEITSSIKKWRNKSMFTAISLSLFFGLFSGIFVSNFETFFKEESIQNAQLLKSKFGEIAALHDTRDPKLYYFVIPDGKKIKEVVSFVEDGKRYIRIEAK